MKLNSKSDERFLLANIITLLIGLISTSTRLTLIIIIFQLISQIIYIYKKRKNLLHFTIIYLGITFIFNIGRVFLEAFFNHTDDIMPPFEIWFSTEAVQKALFYYIFINVFFSLGMIFAFNRKISTNQKIKNVVEKLEVDKQEFELIGWILFMVGIIPKMWIDVNRLIISLTASYLDTYALDLSGVGGLSTFYYVGAIIILVSWVEKKKLAHGFLAFLFLWEVISIFSGKRYDAIAFYIVLIYLYVSLYVGKIDIKKLNYKKAIAGMILLVVLVMILNTMRYSRAETITLESLIQAFILQLGNNPIVEILAEMGNTFLTLVLTVDRVPQITSFGFGESYYGTAISVIPFTGFITNGMTLEFIKLLQFEWAMGGNWIAETYYNFGFLGALVGMFWGWCTIKIDDSICDSTELYKKLIVLPFIFQIIKYTREYFTLFRLSIIQLAFIVVLIFGIRFMKYKGWYMEIENYIKKKLTTIKK